MELWRSFQEMPPLLKFLSAHAIACAAFFVVIVIPNDTFTIDGQVVSYGELWSRGIGPMVAMIGLVMPIAGLLMLKRARYSRQVYLAALSSGLVLPYLFAGKLILTLVGMSFVILIGYYLFAGRSVEPYFASN